MINPLENRMVLKSSHSSLSIRNVKVPGLTGQFLDSLLKIKITSLFEQRSSECVPELNTILNPKSSE